jgi:glycosyltransferase involved in cell wall biosynthesis
VFDAHPDATLVIVGNESYTMRLDEKYTKNVLHLGHVPHDDVHNYFNIADIFVFPTIFNEGFPNVALEAMASGLPIIISKLPGIEEYVEHGTSGLVIPQFDADSFAAAIHRMLTDVALRKRLSANARKAALTRDWKEVVPHMIAFMQSLR